MEMLNKDGDVTKGLYIFLRYNQIRKEDDINLSAQEEKVYEEFKRLYKDLNTSLKNNENKASSQLGHIMALFGFDRRYDAMSGIPIVGKFYKINGRTVSKESYDAWKLVQEMNKMEQININQKD